MKSKIFTLLLFVALSNSVFAQLKDLNLPRAEKYIEPSSLRMNSTHNFVFDTPSKSSFGFPDRSNKLAYIIDQNIKVKSSTPEGRPTFIEFTNYQSNSIKSSTEALLSEIKTFIGEILHVDLSQATLISHEASHGVNHYKFQQEYKGIPIYSGEFFIHLTDNLPSVFNGNTYSVKSVSGNIAEAKSEKEILEILEHSHFVQKNEDMHHLMKNDSLKLIYYPSDVDAQELQLAYYVEFQPSLLESYTYFIDAITGEVINKFDNICRLTHHKSARHNIDCPYDHQEVADGNRTGSATDLNGITREVRYYEVDNIDIMIDASRSMYGGGDLNVENPRGVIWTIDGNNGYPGSPNFAASQITSNNGFKNAPDAVSAYYNAAQSYEYYRNTFQRESIDGNKSTIISLINVRTEEGGEMDNAFWNGAAMFYGSGDVAFKHLAGALDVGAHEMTHGVIQASSNLEYQNESGAINESLADVFGVMVDRDNWFLGEDVTRTSYIPTGRLRDMSDPHNGGSRLGHPGWQPAHFNERYVGTEDNGGVHINSGILNKACYNVGQSMSKSKVEQIFYCAMTKYLTRRSSFKDYRASCEKCAEEIYGQTEKNIVSNAFADVGIGDGGSTEGNNGEIDPNKGEDIILNVEDNGTSLYDKNANILLENFTLGGVNSKPSVSDDGSIILYVDENSQIYAKQVDWENRTIISEGVLDIRDNNNQIIRMRNVCISPSGRRLAFVREVEENVIYLYDFIKQEFKSIILYNPTSAEDIITGDVRYADAMTFNKSGEYLIYDNFNEILKTNGENIQYWDISYASIYNNELDTWLEPRLFSLFGALPGDVSVGNPSFASNTDNVMAYDVLVGNGFFEDYYLATTELNDGQINLIYQNDMIGFPSYSRLDDYIIFTATAVGGGPVTALLPMQNNRILPDGDPFGFILGQWANWFATGSRNLSTDIHVLNEKLRLYPNPARNSVRFDLPDEFSTIEMKVSISDIYGRVLNTTSLNGNNIDISHLNNGLYQVQISSEGKVIRGSLIIQH